LLSSCTWTPFGDNSSNTGTLAGTLMGAGVGGGGMAALGASKSFIMAGAYGGAAVGYYLSSLPFASEPIRRKGGQVFVLGDFVTIEIPTDSLFEPNNSVFLTEATPILNSILAVLSRGKEHNIIVSGNTSGFANEGWELKLSENRAREVAGYIWSNIYYENLFYVGYGNYFPVANNIRANSIRENSRMQITSYPCDLNIQKYHYKVKKMEKPVEAAAAPAKSSNYKGS